MSLAATNNSAAIDVDAPRTTRPKKRSVDDSFISSDVDAETAGKRRASVESAIASGSTVASFTRSSSRDTHASSAASSEPIEDLFDPSSPAPSSADSIPPDAPEWSTYGQKRPWSQEDVVKLMDLKTGSSDPSTKARSYSMLEKDFPGRAGGSIASKWSKIKDSVKIRMLVGEAKRAKKLHARDRTIKATLTGPRRMTWQSFQAQLQQSSQRMQKEEGQRRGEMDLQGSAFCSAPPPPPAMHFSHLSPTKRESSCRSSEPGRSPCCLNRSHALHLPSTASPRSLPRSLVLQRPSSPLDLLRPCFRLLRRLSCPSCTTDGPASAPEQLARPAGLRHSSISARSRCPSAGDSRQLASPRRHEEAQ